MGMSKSESSGSNSSDFFNNSSFNQNVWKGQQQPLKDLYSFGKQLYQDFNPAMYNNSVNYGTDYSRGVSDSAMGGWQDQMNGGAISGAARGTERSLINSLNDSLANPSATGRMYQDIVGGAGNTYIDPMVAAMKRGTIDSLDRQLPGIDSNAISAGQMGSSRHGIAEGLARSDANKYMTDTESTMRGQAYDTDLNWKMQIANQADLGRGQAQDRSINMLNTMNSNQAGAVAGSSGMNGLGGNVLNSQMQGAQLPWQMLENYANTVGSPTVLSSGKSTSSGSSGGDMSSKGGGIGAGGKN